MLLIVFLIASFCSAVVCTLVAVAWDPPLPNSAAAPDTTQRGLVQRVRAQPRLAMLALAGAIMLAVAIGCLRGMRLDVLPLVVFSHVLVALSAIDWRTGWLPDVITQPALWLGLLVQLVAPLATVGLEPAVIGAMAGYLLPLSASWLFLVVKGQAAIGGGDLKLSAMMGAWLGPVSVLFVWCAAPLAMLLVVLPTLRRGGLQRQMVFGPCLSLAGVVWLGMELAGLLT